jgi:hypothetical protein
MAQKYYMENFVKKQFLCFKLHTLLVVWWNLETCHVPCLACKLSPCPVYPHHINYLPINHLAAILVISAQLLWYHSTCVQVSLTLLSNDPQTTRVVILAILYCCNYSTLLLLIIVNHWLTNLQTELYHMYVCMHMKKDGICRVQYYLWF